MRIRYFSYCHAMKAQVSLRKCADLPEPLQLTYTKYVRLLALLDMSECVFKGWVSSYALSIKISCNGSYIKSERVGSAFRG